MKCRRHFEIIIVSGFLYLAFFISSFFFLAIGNEFLCYGAIIMSSISFLLAFISLIKLANITGRLFAPERDGIKIKTEGGCFEDWDGKVPVDIDGVCIDGKKYAVANGVDIIITKEGKIKYCSVVAKFFNRIRQKAEQKAMQESDCWKC